MANRTLSMTDQLYDYLVSVSAQVPEVFQRLREETARLPMAMMKIGRERGQFMPLWVRATGEKRALEIGVFPGYSGLPVASPLREAGRLTACDVNEEWTPIARRYWQ